jgi:hypothetical protein
MRHRAEVRCVRRTVKRCQLLHRYGHISLPDGVNHYLANREEEKLKAGVAVFVRLFNALQPDSLPLESNPVTFDSYLFHRACSDCHRSSRLSDTG